MRVYIAGAMEYSDQRDWWFELCDLFQEYGLDGIIPFDASSSSIAVEEIYEKTRHDKNSIAHKIITEKIVSQDIDILIPSCDALFVKYTEAVRLGAGTHGELTVARFLKMPIVVWVDNYNMQHVPSWVYGCATHVTPIKEVAIQKLIDVCKLREDAQCKEQKEMSS